jgi:hypothetical protein
MLTTPSFPPEGDAFEPFPRLELLPVAGAAIMTVHGDRTTEVDFVLGIRLTSDAPSLSARGVWLDYEVNGQQYRAMLPWLLSVCPEPVSTTCQTQPAREFSFPPT